MEPQICVLYVKTSRALPKRKGVAISIMYCRWQGYKPFIYSKHTRPECNPSGAHCMCVVSSRKRSFVNSSEFALLLPETRRRRTRFPRSFRTEIISSYPMGDETEGFSNHLCLQVLEKGGAMMPHLPVVQSTRNVHNQIDRAQS